MTSRRPLVAGDAAWTLDPTPVTSIGANETDTNQHFVRIRDALLFSDGNVAISADGQIRWFDARGRFLAATRRGSGPGELQSVEYIVRTRGDTLVAGGGGRILSFDRAGKWLEERRKTCERRILDTLSFWTCMDSRIGHLPYDILVVTGESATEAPDRQQEPEIGINRTVRRLFLTRPPYDLLKPLGLDGGIASYGAMVPGVGVRTIVHPMYVTITYLAFDATVGVLAIATNPAYEVQLWTLDARLLRIVRRESGRRTPQPADVNEARRYIATQDPPGGVDTWMDLVPVPDSVPAVWGLWISPSGELLVQTHGWQFEQPPSFDVFDGEGRWLGKFTLPPRSRLLDVRREHVLVRRIDNNDVELAEVYRIRRMAR